MTEYQIWKSNTKFLKMYMKEHILIIKKTHYIVKRTENIKLNQKKYYKTENGRLARNRAKRNWYAKNKDRLKIKREEKKKLKTIEINK